MKEKIKTLICVLCLLQINSIWADDATKQIFKMPDIIPLSPEVSSLGKYGDIPVGEYTGTPSISIPIYTVKAGSIEVPINLSYHASEIKVTQEATWVGLGWDLIAGGCISTMVVGKKDKETLYTDWNMYNEAATYHGDTYNPNGYPFVNSQLYYIKGSTGYAHPGVMAYTEGMVGSSERDIYSFNFLNKSFNVLIHPKDRHIVFVGEKNKCKIERIFKTDTPTWKVADENGVIYLFDQKQYSYGYGEAYNLPTTWYLTQIIAPNGDWVKFKYTVSAKHTIFPSTTTEYRIDYPYPYDSKVRSDNELNNVTLNSIQTKVDSIVFQTKPRVDIPQGVLLNCINVYSKLDNTNKETYQFNYDYFVGEKIGGDYIEEDATLKTNYQNIITEDNKRKRLKLISFSRTINDKSICYSFGYNDSLPLPYKTSYAVDYWGNYNGQDNHSFLPNMNIMYNYNKYNTIDSTIYNKLTFNGNSGGANRNASWKYIQVGMLKSIVYPTGGQTCFNYEPHSFSNYYYPDADSTSKNDNSKHISIGGGVRIKSIVNKDIVGTIIFSQNYNYKNSDGTNSGKLITPLRFWKYSTISAQDPGDGTRFWTYAAISHRSFSYHNLPHMFGGTIVGYDQVNVDNNVGSKKNGKSSFFFINNPAFYTNDFYWIDPFLLPNGLLTKKYLFNSKNDTLQTTVIENQQIEKEIEYLNFNVFDTTIPSQYNTNGASDSLPNFKITFGTQEYIQWYNALVLANHSNLSVTGYPNINYKTLVSSTTTTDYLNGGKIVNTVNYLYNPNNYQPSETSETTSGGLDKKIQLKYPPDYSSTAPYDSLVARNIIAPVVETSVYKGSTFLNRTKTNYSFVTAGGVIKPLSVENQVGTNASKIRIQYAKYDANYNPVYLIQNEADNVVFLWSYNYQYPVAKIVGLTYAEVENVLGQSFIDGLSTKLLPSGDEINTIRTKLASTLALVTTFTYKPLVGMVTATDSRGITANYTYDTFNRLYLARNNNSNVLARYQYGYQNNPDNGQGGYTTPSGVVIPGNGKYFIGDAGTAAISNVSGGSGIYTYSWFLKNSSGEILKSALNTNSTSFSYTCSQTGTLKIQCVITDNQTGVTSTASTNINCVFNFTFQPGFNNVDNSFILVGSTISFYMAFWTTSTMLSNTSYLLANVGAGARPSTPQNITYTTANRNWVIIITPSGDIYLRITNGSDFSGSVGFGTLSYTL